MARRPRSTPLETRTARLKLPPRRKPHDFTSIAPGIALGYRRNQRGAGTWVARVADGRGGAWTKAIAVADDHEEANGNGVLTFWQAQDRTRAVARGSAGDDDTGRPCTVREALATYESDLKARGSLTANAIRVQFHLPAALADKPIAILSSRELQRFRDGLVTKMKPASVNRLLRGLKAALTLAAKHDARIKNAGAWKLGLSALPDAYVARNVILPDQQVLALVAAAYAENLALGMLTEVAATTGARPSQLARLEIGDLQTDRSAGPRLQMPTSRKGRGRKRISRYPIPIPASLAARLRQTAGEPSAPLLRQTNGRNWSMGSSDYRRPFRRVVARAKLDPSVTFYSLRHSSIVRMLLAGVPVRLVAVAHDTSVAMIERSYSKYIGDHADTILRGAMLDVAAKPAEANNVMPMARK